jgi:peptide/nickel transport system permease protein
MGSLILRRLVALIPTMLLATFAVFGLITLVPGDAAQTLAGGDNATPERIEEVRKEFGLDKPFLVQYGNWLKGAVQGDLGKSLASGNSISSEIRQAFPVSASIVFAAIIVGLSVGIPAGMFAGMRPGSKLDRSLVGATTFGIAVPSFVMAMLLITLFAVNRKWFPAIGFTKFSDSPVEWLKSVTLPAVSVSAGVAASMARQVRAALADVLNSAYVRTAWAKGGSTKRVVGKHALKNAAIPAVTVFGLQVGGLLGGAVLIENIYAIPGLGTYVLRGVLALDLPVIQGVALMFVLVNVVISLLVDISYGYLNPKVRVS